MIAGAISSRRLANKLPLLALALLALLLLSACTTDDDEIGATNVALAATMPAGTATAAAPAQSTGATSSFMTTGANTVTATTAATGTASAAATASATAAATTTPTATAIAAVTATSTATTTANPTPTVTSTPSAFPPLALTSGDPQPYLEQFTMISFYGSAEGAGMGILNFRDTPQLLVELRQRTAEYQELLPDKVALPAFHIIVTVADPWFGEDRNFNHHLSLESIEQWLALAEREGIAVVLDIQPGHAPVQEEFERIRPYLYHPHVHLALDSEYTMERTPGGLYEIPGDVLGSLYAEQINPIQAQLEEIALEIGVNKVLIVHQFEDEMLPDKENVEDYAHVELVVDSDGFGGPDKVRDYHQYADEPAFEYGGIKLYRNWDNPLLTPEDVTELDPPPAVVIYQ